MMILSMSLMIAASLSFCLLVIIAFTKNKAFTFLKACFYFYFVIMLFAFSLRKVGYGSCPIPFIIMFLLLQKDKGPVLSSLQEWLPFLGGSGCPELQLQC